MVLRLEIREPFFEIVLVLGVVHAGPFGLFCTLVPCRQVRARCVNGELVAIDPLDGFLLLGIPNEPDVLLGRMGVDEIDALFDLVGN